MNVMNIRLDDLVRWSYYTTSKGNTLYVAEAICLAIHQLANIMGMNEQEKIDYMNGILMMGHSLGAHVCGLVGSMLTVPHANNAALTEKRLGTIIALDAAGPCFRPFKRKRHCLTRHDAKRVIGLHTDDPLFGNRYRCAHEDWFVNGGVCISEMSAANHFRCLNLARELIWTVAVGYICKVPNRKLREADLDDSDLTERTELNLTRIPEGESEVVPHPIFCFVNRKFPYFASDLKPKKIPAYNVKTKAGWDKVKFK